MYTLPACTPSVVLDRNADFRSCSAAQVRPWKRLLSFKRVTLAAGASAVVRIELTQDNLEFYDDEMTLRVVPGDYTLSVGGNSYSAAQNAVSLSIP